MIPPPARILKRLENEANVWVATVRPDGRPHLTPVWFAWHDDKFYACIQKRSVKGRNLQQNPQVSLALEDGSSATICEGTATLLSPPWPEEVAAVFKNKYDWDITTGSSYDQLIEITPVKWLTW